MRTSEAETCRHKSPETARSQSARNTRIGEGRKIGLTRPVPVTSCQSAMSPTKAKTLTSLRCSMAKPPPRNASLRSRAVSVRFMAAVDSDMRHELAIGHNRLLFDQRPEALAEPGDRRLVLRFGALCARDRDRDDLPHPPRPPGQHADAVGDTNRFLKVVRHIKDRRMVALPQRQDVV